MNIYEDIPSNIKDAKRIQQEYVDKDSDIKEMILDKCQHDEHFKSNLGKIEMKDLKYLEPEDLAAYENFINSPEWTSDLDKEFLIYCKSIDDYAKSSEDKKKAEIRKKFKEALQNLLFEVNWRVQRKDKYKQ